jgi:predicted transcriptional regulator
MAARGVGYAGSAEVPRKDIGVLSVSAALCCQTRNVVRWKGHIAEENMEDLIWVGCRDLNAVVVSQQGLLIYVQRAAEDSRAAEAVQHGSRAVG